jgi:mRNA-degrading endonuclease YafQ of YafQ-DinJ toxin-antitoxin module
MRTLIWSKTFLKASKKVMSRRPEFQKEIENTLRILVRDPFDPQLKTHKLKGKLLFFKQPTYSL